jgi:RNA polymerase primary sigma factor
MINAGQPIHIPAYLVKLISKWRQGRSELESRLGRPPTVEEMAKHLHISAKRAAIVQQGLTAVNAPSQMGSDETQAISEVVAGTEAPPEQAILDQGNLPFAVSLLEHLPPRERKILELRYGMDGYEGPPRTFKEIGKLVGLTRERVRQLEKQALAQLHELIQDL